jgi:hypothetical protein
MDIEALVWNVEDGGFGQLAGGKSISNSEV